MYMGDGALTLVSEWTGKACLNRDLRDETEEAMGISGAERSSRENIKCRAP